MKPPQQGAKGPSFGDDPAPRAERLKALVAGILAEAKRQGASAAEVSASDDAGLGVTVRKGELETVEFNNDRGFGITVHVGQRKGSANTSDDSAEAVRETVRAALNIAKYTAEDACNGLADAELMATTLPQLDLHHPWAVDVEQATALAEETEAAALAFDSRIVNSEGAQVSTQRACHVYGNSHGFVEAAWGTRHAVSCALIAADEDGMQQEHWYTVARDHEDLQNHVQVGEEAARRAVARLGRQPIETGSYPVLFAPPMAAGLISHLLAALSGGAQYRQESFLLDSIGRAVLPESITLAEHPHRAKGIGSAAFDGDGVATRPKAFVQDGCVASYVLGTYSARRLGLATTANAGGIFNLDVETETVPVEALMRDMGTGLVVTSLMGQGVNLVTGDYSRGAGGIWVENGEPSHAVDEVTIAANLADLFKGIVGCGDDIDRRGSIRCGSILVEQMTVAA